MAEHTELGGADGVESPAVETGSVLGVVSLGMAVVSVGACLVASALALGGRAGAVVVVFGLPVLGLGAALVGGLALMKRRSAGVPLVRGPAAFGILIGIASAVLQGSVAVGALMAYVPVKKMVVPVVTGMVTEVEAGRPERALDAVLESSRSVIGAARVEALVLAATDVVGEPMRASVGMDIIVRSRRVFAEAAGRGGGQGAVPDLGLQVKAVELVGPRGRLVMYLVLDEASLTKDKVRIADAMVVLGDGRCAVLLPDGRMRELARYLGLAVVGE